ncbi:MAG: hypothetical protein U9N33_07635 [Campylobacterota bacterium]|nr:hypothetical protein [Campylobacterota bacterium]
MKNPFESGHIKNYIFAYIGVVVIMVLFFIASTLFHDVQSVDKKKFEVGTKSKPKAVETSSDNSPNYKYKLLPKSY